ncbi:MAG: hypothetical protein AAGD11_06095 [Planctomycetota bacterium]
MCQIDIHFVDDETWSEINSDLTFWHDFGSEAEAVWDTFTDRCDALDEALRELLPSDTTYVIDTLTYFSHRGFECTHEDINVELLRRIQEALKTRFSEFYVTASVWTSLEGGKNTGLLGVYADKVVATNSLKPLFELKVSKKNNHCMSLLPSCVKRVIHFVTCHR